MIRARLLLAALGLAACDRATTPPAPAASAASATAATTTTAAPAADDLGPITFASKGRIVAIGDLHGDLQAARAALRLAGAVDDQDRWSGAELVVVQTGDQIDRGDQDREILELFDRLAGEAEKAGGAVHALNGNHEIMNVDLDFRYVTPGAFGGFDGLAGASLADPRLAPLPPQARPRAAAFLPGGPIARLLSRRHIAVLVDGTAFVHGGILPQHVRSGVAKLDREVREWMEGKRGAAPAAIGKEDSPVWARRYSAAPDASDCAVLRDALAALGAKRMVVGHTVQQSGINPACAEKVWRIDVGLSSYYGGKTEVLEIAGDTVRPIRQGP